MPLPWAFALCSSRIHPTITSNNTISAKNRNTTNSSSNIPLESLYEQTKKPSASSSSKSSRKGMSSPPTRMNCNHLFLCAMSSSPKSTPILPPMSSPITADRCRPLVSPGVYIVKDKSSRARRHSWFVDGKLIEMPCDSTQEEKNIIQPMMRATSFPIANSGAQVQSSSRRGRSTVSRSSAETQRRHTR